MTDLVNFRLFRTIIVAAVLCLLLPNSGIAAALKVGGTGAALGAMRVLADAFMESHPDVSIEIPSSLGSGGGIRAAIAGALDIGLSARPLKAKERDAGANQLAYAKSPFVLVTSRNLAEPSLTSAQVTEMFSSTRAAWADGTPVRIILRPEDDSDTEILVSAFAGMSEALARARKVQGVPVASTDQEAMDKAEVLPGALATATLSSILVENRALTPITIDGIAPTLDNLADGSYRISKTLHLITGLKVSQLAQDFIRFIQSEAGAAILRKTGNLPM